MVSGDIANDTTGDNTWLETVGLPHAEIIQNCIACRMDIALTAGMNLHQAIQPLNNLHPRTDPRRLQRNIHHLINLDARRDLNPEGRIARQWQKSLRLGA